MLSNPYRKLLWAEVGQTYIHIRRNCTLWFWQCKNLAVRTKVVKNKATGTPHGVYCIQPSLASDVFMFVVDGGWTIYLHHTWGFRRCISVAHSKTTILICYILDYQQVHDNANVSIILLGDKKEPTKWKTNPVQQILLPNNHFPCYFYFKNHFYWRKEKRCVTCLWLPTKANTQI